MLNNYLFSSLKKKVYIDVSTMYIHIRCSIYGLFYRGNLLNRQKEEKKNMYENSTLWLCFFVNLWYN